MNTKLIALFAAASMPLAACSSMNNNSDLATVGTGAAIGAAGGTGIAAIAGGDLLTGAVIGAAVGGIAGAVWADRNNDGRADGYMHNGMYHEGRPDGNYQGASAQYSQPRSCRSVAGTALAAGAVGAAVGAGATALGDGNVLQGAVIGAAVGGIGGAIWADSNNDGCTDGYIREGRYYPGSPMIQRMPVNYTSGERG